MLGLDVIVLEVEATEDGSDGEGVAVRQVEDFGRHGWRTEAWKREEKKKKKSRGQKGKGSAVGEVA